MTAKRRFLAHVIFTACLLLIPFQKSQSEDEPTPKAEDAFFLSGDAYKEKDGTLTVNIVNNSTDGSVYLISQGGIHVVSYDEDKSGNVISGVVMSVIGDPSLDVVYPTKPNTNLLTVIEFISKRIEIPQEYRDRQIDFVKVTVKLCKTPITTKNIELHSCSVLLPVKPRK